MKKLLTNEFIIVLLLALLFVFANLSQTFAYIRATPQGFVYPLVHNYVEDYYYYLHLMRQGFDGMWKATSRLTPETFPPVFVNPFFLLLGHIARIGGISLPLTYTIARGLGGLGVIGFTYVLIGKVFPTSGFRRVITLLIVFASTYFWGWGSGGPQVASLVHEWTELDPLFRLTYIPHHLWSKVLMLLVFLFMLGALKNTNVRLGIAAVLVTVLMGFVSPVVLATFVPTVLLWFFLLALFSRTETIRRFPILLFVSVLGVAVAVALYHRIVQNGVFPWTSYLWWERVQYAVTLKTYIQSLGPNFFLFLLGIPFLLQQKKMGLLFVAWVATSFITLFLLTQYVPLTNSRYLGGYQFIPLGIGASVTLFHFRDFIYQHGNMLTRYIVPLVFGFLLFFNTIGLWASWKEHVGYVASNRWNIQVFVPVGVIDAFTYLNREAKGDVVVAPLDISTMIPALTGSRVISGHKTITYEYDRKNRELASFFSHEEVAFAKEFLSTYHARYVFAYQPSLEEERTYRDLGLFTVYNNATVHVLRVP